LRFLDVQDVQDDYTIVAVLHVKMVGKAAVYCDMHCSGIQ